MRALFYSIVSALALVSSTPIAAQTYAPQNFFSTLGGQCSAPNSIAIQGANQVTTCVQSSTITGNPTVAKVQNFLANHPGGIPSVMTSPPTLVQQANGNTTTIKNSFFVPAIDPRLGGHMNNFYQPLYTGALADGISRTYYFGAPEFSGVFQPIALDFMSDAAQIDFLCQSGVGGNTAFTILVNGQLISPTATVFNNAGGGRFLSSLTFASSSERHIQVIVDYASGFAGVFLSQNNSLTAAPNNDPAFSFMTDSYGQVHGSIVDSYALMHEAVLSLGGIKIWNDTVGGSGYYQSNYANGTAITFTSALTNATSATMTANWSQASGNYYIVFSDGSTHLGQFTNGAAVVVWTGAVTGTTAATAGPNVYPNYILRLGTMTLASYPTDVHVTMGGINDLSAANIATYAPGYFQTLRSMFPNAILVATGPWCPVELNCWDGTQKYMGIRDQIYNALKADTGKWVFIDNLADIIYNSDGTVIKGSGMSWQTGVGVAATLTVAPSAATSATMTGNWTTPPIAGTYQGYFSDGSVKNLTVTPGSANISWTGAVTASTALPIALNYAFGSSHGLTIATDPSSTTSASLLAPWPAPSGNYVIQFSDSTKQTTYITNGATTINWPTVTAAGLTQLITYWEVPTGNAGIYQSYDWTHPLNSSYLAQRLAAAIRTGIMNLKQ